MPKRVARNRQTKTTTAEADALPLTGSSGVIPIALLATGTPDGTKYVRDDGTLAVPPGLSTFDPAIDNMFTVEQTIPGVFPTGGVNGDQFGISGGIFAQSADVTGSDDSAGFYFKAGGSVNGNVGDFHVDLGIGSNAPGGGNVLLTAAGTTTGVAGALTFRSGPSDGASDSGTVELSSGACSNAGDSGYVRVDSGAVSGGSAGDVKIGDTNAQVILIGHSGSSTSILGTLGFVESGGPTGLTIGAITDGEVLVRSGTTITSSTLGGLDSSAFYGDGSDGDLNFNGIATPVAGATLSGSVYTLQRDIYADDLTVASAVHLKGNFRIYVNGTCSGVDATSIIGNPGANAANNVGGAGGNGGGVSGTINTTTSYAGANGGTGVGSNASAGGASSCGGPGGNGGAGSGGAGGTGGGVTATTAANGGTGICRVMPFAVMGCTNAMTTKFLGGAGGGGGGGDGTAAGGGGGGGGVAILCARHFSGTLTVSCKGGNGGSPAAGNRGGGGGGGGGVMVVVTSETLPAGITVTALKGTGGTKTGTGVNGSDGTNGISVVLIG